MEGNEKNLKEIIEDTDFSTFTPEELGKTSAELEVMIGKINKILNKYEDNEEE